MKMLRKLPGTQWFRLGLSRKGLHVCLEQWIAESGRKCVSLDMIDEREVRYEFRRLREELEILERQAISKLRKMKAGEE